HHPSGRAEWLARSSEPCRCCFFRRSKCFGAGVRDAGIARKEQITRYRCTQLFEGFESIETDYFAEFRSFVDALSEVGRTREIGLQKPANRGIDLDPAFHAKEELRFGWFRISFDHPQARHHRVQAGDRFL